MLLESSLVEKMNVRLKATLEIAHADSKLVEVSLWYGSVLDLPSELINELYEYQHMWKNFVKFTPRIVTLGCPMCPKEIKEETCFSDGLYCLMPAKKTKLDKVRGNVTDASLLLETLWGRCLFQTYRDRDQDALHYFNYLHDLMFTCLG